MFNLQCGAERGNDHHVISGDLLPRDELGTLCIHDELNTATFEVAVHFLVVDHLAKEVNIFSNALLQRLIADLNGIFYSVAKAEMPGQNKLDGAKVKHRRRKILLAQIFNPPGFFDLARDGGTVVDRYIELFNGSVFIVVAKLPIVPRS